MAAEQAASVVDQEVIVVRSKQFLKVWLRC